jgi:hypothetical protein
MFFKKNDRDCSKVVQVHSKSECSCIEGIRWSNTILINKHVVFLLFYPTPVHYIYVFNCIYPQAALTQLTVLWWDSVVLWWDSAVRELKMGVVGKERQFDSYSI